MSYIYSRLKDILQTSIFVMIALGLHLFCFLPWPLWSMDRSDQWGRSIRLKQKWKHSIEISRELVNLKTIQQAFLISWMIVLTGGSIIVIRLHWGSWGELEFLAGLSITLLSAGLARLCLKNVKSPLESGRLWLSMVSSSELAQTISNCSMHRLNQGVGRVKGSRFRDRGWHLGFEELARRLMEPEVCLNETKDQRRCRLVLRNMMMSSAGSYHATRWLDRLSKEYYHQPMIFWVKKWLLNEPETSERYFLGQALASVSFQFKSETLNGWPHRYKTIKWSLVANPEILKWLWLKKLKDCHNDWDQQVFWDWLNERVSKKSSNRTKEVLGGGKDTVEIDEFKSEFLMQLIQDKEWSIICHEAEFLLEERALKEVLKQKQEHLEVAPRGLKRL